jgi:DNA-binding IclR family transcriptional regulator
VSAPEAWHVSRTLRALEFVALGPRSAGDVADALGIHVRTARRLLERLVEEGYLARQPGPRRHYVSTMRVVALAGHVVEHNELVRVARPFLARLQAECGQVAHLTVPSLLSVLCALHEMGGGTTTHPSLGERVPAHATAAGKALLGARPEWRRHVLAQPLERFTIRTLVDSRVLEEDVLVARMSGYAVEDGEYREGIRAVAAPVFSHTGEAVGALGVAGELEAARLHQLGKVAAQMAAGLSEALGFASSNGAVAASQDVPSQG